MVSADIRAQRLAFAKAMISELEDALREGAGIVSVSTDGVSTTMSRDQALKELEHWRKQENRYSRSKSRTTTINLSNSHG